MIWRRILRLIPFLMKLSHIFQNHLRVTFANLLQTHMKSITLIWRPLTQRCGCQNQVIPTFFKFQLSPWLTILMILTILTKKGCHQHLYLLLRLRLLLVLLLPTTRKITADAAATTTPLPPPPPPPPTLPKTKAAPAATVPAQTPAAPAATVPAQTPTAPAAPAAPAATVLKTNCHQLINILTCL